MPGLSRWPLVATCLLLVVPFSRSEEPAPTAASEMKKLEGEWKIVAVELGGEAGKSDDLVTFAGNKCIVTNTAAKLTFENTYSVDPSKKPYRMEVTNIKTKEKWVGIYEWKGDTFRAVFTSGKDGKVPTEMKTTKGTLEVMFTYERARPN